MQNRLTRRRFVAGATAALGTVGLAGCLGGGDDDGVPDASFTFEVGDTSVTVTHDDGDSLTEDNTGAVQILRVADDTETLLGSWELPVEEGNSVTVDGNFESGQTVVVRWLTPNQEEFADLASHDIE
jgi:hypothetical protein